MSNLSNIHTAFGLVCVEPVDVAELKPGDVFISGFTPAPEDDDPYTVFVATDVNRRRVEADAINDGTEYGTSGAIFDCGDRESPKAKIIATLYEEPADGGREVHDVGQVMYGGQLVCFLRDVASEADLTLEDMESAADVIVYATAAGLIETPADRQYVLTEDGADLLEAIDGDYRSLGRWYDNLDAAVAL